MGPLLERDDELAAVDRLLEGGGVLIIEGRAGIGKTALLGTACRLGAERGRGVLRARGSEAVRRPAGARSWRRASRSAWCASCSNGS